MFETEPEIAQLQTLLDQSLARSTAHLRSIITPGERSLRADQVVRLLDGMCVLVLSTVTAQGEPRVSAVDGHLIHGRWVFGTSRGAAKARHLRARPAASVAHLRGEELGVFVHGVAETLNPADGPAAQDWPQIHDYLRGVYGEDSFDWHDVVYFRLRPTWMAVYASEPQRLLGELDRAAS